MELQNKVKAVIGSENDLSRTKRDSEIKIFDKDSGKMIASGTLGAFVADCFRMIDQTEGNILLDEIQVWIPFVRPLLDVGKALKVEPEYASEVVYKIGCTVMHDLQLKTLLLRKKERSLLLSYNSTSDEYKTDDVDESNVCGKQRVKKQKLNFPATKINSGFFENFGYKDVPVQESVPSAGFSNAAASSNAASSRTDVREGGSDPREAFQI
jgi:hypothetical protein